MFANVLWLQQRKVMCGQEQENNRKKTKLHTAADQLHSIVSLQCKWIANVKLNAFYQLWDMKWYMALKFNSFDIPFSETGTLTTPQTTFTATESTETSSTSATSSSSALYTSSLDTATTSSESTSFTSTSTFTQTNATSEPERNDTSTFTSAEPVGTGKTLSVLLRINGGLNWTDDFKNTSSYAYSELVSAVLFWVSVLSSPASLPAWFSLTSAKNNSGVFLSVSHPNSHKKYISLPFLVLSMMQVILWVLFAILMFWNC